MILIFSNFLLLGWLLKRFLYRPILDSTDAREAEIAERMQEATHVTERAQAEQQAYQDKLQALNAAQSEVTEKVRKLAEDQRDVLLAEAQKSITREHAAWQAHLDEETRKYTAKMHRAGAGALLSLTRKALCDLADETLEAQMAHHLILQLEPMVPDFQRVARHATEALILSNAASPASVEEELIAELRGTFPRWLCS